ncbi:glycosyltransferase [Paenibacillus athensensis]|uniref:Glycosyltransferase n=1 Tax=Paenibacillus athensensis TaxID=1967502 RepID=A0A4Y8PWC0_9BACL|nr:glycosyltransferase [Paenibacillus athensensis]MCD1260599.1 glycosyltransferase [Paenibacillus athensensis]
MKILFTFYNPSGGMETLNRTRCKALIEHGVDCHLLYKFNGFGLPNSKHIPTLICSDFTRIAQFVKKEQFDAIIVCTDYELLASLREGGYQGPIVYEMQGLGDLQTANSIINRAKPSVCAHATAILSPKTSHLINIAKKEFPAKPFFCFDNPVDSTHFHYRRYPPKSHPILAWVGRIEANKNWLDFVQIGHQLSHRIPDLRLWMFSDQSLFEPEEKLKFEQKIQELQLEHKLIRYSYLPHEQMSDYFSIIGDSGGLLCSTSVMEGFGYAVAEAMLCHCPVLSTDSDGVRNFIIPHKTGMFYSRGNINQAVELAYRIMNNRALRNKLRKRGERYIQTRFACRKYVNQFTAMLRKLVTG